MNSTSSVKIAGTNSSSVPMITSRSTVPEPKNALTISRRCSDTGSVLAPLLGQGVAGIVGCARRRPRAEPVVAGAVDGDHAARVEVARRRGQVGHQPGHLLRLADPLR